MAARNSPDTNPVFALWVSGVPRAWQRSGGHGTRRFTQPPDRQWRATVRAAWLDQVGALNLCGPVSLTLVFCGARGDWDNAAKSVSDALGMRGWGDGLAPAYRDDRQVVEAHVYLVPATCREAGVFIAVTASRTGRVSGRQWRASMPPSSPSGSA